MIFLRQERRDALETDSHRKTKIEVDPTSGILLHQTTQTYASACNFVSDYIFKTRDLNRIHLRDVLYYRIRDNFGLGSQMVESVIKNGHRPL